MGIFFDALKTAGSKVWEAGSELASVVGERAGARVTSASEKAANVITKGADAVAGKTEQVSEAMRGGLSQQEYHRMMKMQKSLHPNDAGSLKEGFDLLKGGAASKQEFMDQYYNPLRSHVANHKFQVRRGDEMERSLKTNPSGLTNLEFRRRAKTGMTFENFNKYMDSKGEQLTMKGSGGAKTVPVSSNPAERAANYQSFMNSDPLRKGFKNWVNENGLNSHRESMVKKFGGKGWKDIAGKGLDKGKELGTKAVNAGKGFAAGVGRTAGSVFDAYAGEGSKFSRNFMFHTAAGALTGAAGSAAGAVGQAGFPGSIDDRKGMVQSALNGAMMGAVFSTIKPLGEGLAKSHNGGYVHKTGNMVKSFGNSHLLQGALAAGSFAQGFGSLNLTNPINPVK